MCKQLFFFYNLCKHTITLNWPLFSGIREQTSLGICAVWSVLLLSTSWRASHLDLFWTRNFYFQPWIFSSAGWFEYHFVTNPEFRQFSCINCPINSASQGTKIFQYCTCTAGWVTYNFRSSCKHMHLFFIACIKEHKGVIWIIKVPDITAKMIFTQSFL